MKRTWMLSVSVALVAAGCGSSSASGTTRTVLVDYKHDAFASSFFHYYPSNVVVHPGDTVDFKFTWTGEPHSVTMGQVVDKLFEYAPIVEKYNSKEDALAHGEDPAFIDKVDMTFSKLPGMTGHGQDIYQPGARPCFVDTFNDIPRFTDDGDNPIVAPSANCPKGDEIQPTFTGTQGLYNSGFVPFQGASANKFVVKIAKNAVPGTYNYFCNYHWTNMHGKVKIVPKTTKIPSASTVARQARTEIGNDAKNALKRVAKAKAAKYGKVAPPLVGINLGKDDQSGVQVNDFYPKTFHASVGKPVTWTNGGYDHTVSFNVPKYFPVFTVGNSGNVVWDPKSYEAAGWSVPKAAEVPDGENAPARQIDVGKWNGGGGYHSSGLLSFDDTFAVTFTKPGTYPYACVIHPPMIGTVVVSA